MFVSPWSRWKEQPSLPATPPTSRWPQCADVVALGGFALFSVVTVRARKPSSGPRPREPRRRSVVRADFPRSARSGLSRGRRVSPQVRGGHPGAERCLRRHGRWELEACARALSARPRGLARAARPRGSEVRSSPGPATVRSLATSSPPLRGDHAPPRTRRGAQLHAGRAGPGRREAGGSVQKLDGSRRSWGPRPAAVFLAVPLKVLPHAPRPHAPLQPRAGGSRLLAEPQHSFSILAQAPALGALF